MSKRCQCVGKKMALLVLRRVGLCVGQNQMCQFVRLAFRVVFLSVCCCSVGRHMVATNGLQPRAVADCGAHNCQAKIMKMRKWKAKTKRTNGNSFWVLLCCRTVSEQYVVKRTQFAAAELSADSSPNPRQIECAWTWRCKANSVAFHGLSNEMFLMERWRAQTSTP